MIKSARIALIAMFCLLVGGMMLTSGESPLATALVLVGFVVILIGGNAARSRSRARRGKANDFTFDLTDWTSLQRRDWALLFLHLVIGISLLGAGFANLRGGA